MNIFPSRKAPGNPSKSQGRKSVHEKKYLLENVWLNNLTKFLISAPSTKHVPSTFSFRWIVIRIVFWHICWSFTKEFRGRESLIFTMNINVKKPINRFTIFFGAYLFSRNKAKKIALQAAKKTRQIDNGIFFFDALN